MDRRIKNKVIELRKQGKTYTEIKNELGLDIPKSTISCWCSDIALQGEYREKIRNLNLSALDRARKAAIEVKRAIRIKEIEAICEDNIHLLEKIKDKDVAKIALAMLYWGEGSKNRKVGAMMFGNSDPMMVSAFLFLLRNVYRVDESKFRCTLQCRADQDIKGLEKFWSNVTKVPLGQFYKARIDPRTIGKPSKKPNYKGVIRIDYFSAKVFAELLEIPRILYKGL